MFRIVADPPVLWESLLPAEVLELPPSLRAADVLLDTPGLVDAYRPHFSTVAGRRSIPMETYLRLMFLKFRYRFGYERLVAEVAGSVSFRLFCRIGLMGSVPDDSTLKKITKRCGNAPVAVLNDVMIRGGHDRGLVDVSRVRVDTTFVDANIRRPTDSGLLTQAVKNLAFNCGHLAGCLGLNTGICSWVLPELKELNTALGRCLAGRQPDRKDQAAQINTEIAELAETVASQAHTVVEAAGPLLEGRHRVPKGTRRALNTAARTLEVMDRLVFQAKERANGRTVPAAAKRLSIHDPDCRPMSKSTSKHRGTQFAYTGEITEDNTGLVVDYQIHIGQPSDAALIGAAIARVSERAETPGVVTADGTFGAAAARHDLAEVGVDMIAIKAKGNQPIEQHRYEASPEFRAHRRWRSGVEARISHLKRDYGWDRLRMPTITGARTWAGWGIFTHNTHKLALRI